MKVTGMAGSLELELHYGKLPIVDHTGLCKSMHSYPVGQLQQYALLPSGSTPYLSKCILNRVEIKMKMPSVGWYNLSANNIS